MKKFLTRTLACLLTIFIAFAAAGCSDNGAHTYWKVVKKSANGSLLEYFAMIDVEGASSSNEIGEIWVNLSGFESEKVTIDLAFATSATPTTYYSRISKSIDRLLASDAEGWVKLCEGVSIRYEFCLVTLSESVHFNEIVFLSSDKKPFNAVVAIAGERDAANPSMKREYDLDAASSAEKGSENYYLADKITDEKNWFNYKTVSALYEKALRKKEKDPPDSAK